MAETCKACGKAWTDHIGVEPTCALLQDALDVVRVFSNIKFLETVRDARNNGFTLKRLCNDLLCEKTGHCAVFENGYDYIHFDLNSLS